MKKQGSVKKISVTPKGGKDKGKAKTENKADKEESKETAAERRARVKKKFKRAKLIIGAAKGFKVKKFERRTSKISKSPTDGGPTADIDSTKKKALGSRRASKIQALTERMSTTENIAKDETYIMHHEMGLPPETIKKCQKRPSMWATSEFAYFDIGTSLLYYPHVMSSMTMVLYATMISNVLVYTDDQALKSYMRVNAHLITSTIIHIHNLIHKYVYCALGKCFQFRTYAYVVVQPCKCTKCVYQMMDACIYDLARGYAWLQCPGLHSRLSKLSKYTVPCTTPQSLCGSTTTKPTATKACWIQMTCPT